MKKSYQTLHEIDRGCSGNLIQPYTNSQLPKLKHGEKKSRKLYLAQSPKYLVKVTQHIAVNTYVVLNFNFLKWDRLTDGQGDTWTTRQRMRKPTVPFCFTSTMGTNKY